MKETRKTEIIQEYQNGTSISDLRLKFHISYYTFKKIAQEKEIRLRTLSEANHLRQRNDIVISKELLERINGELLGDGSITKGVCQSSFSFTNKISEYACWLSFFFINSNIPLVSNKIYKSERFHKKWKTWHTAYNFVTISTVQFHELRYKWYDVGGKKHIPKDLKITPNLCLHWWMGDGSLMNRINGILCSECFDKGEQENLCLKLNKEIGINSHLVKYKNSYRIFLISKDIKKFLEYIGNPPFNEISYKWNYRGNI